MVFLPAGERELAAVPSLSVGIMSATQGAYSTSQFLLDATQGARVAASAYPESRPPVLALAPVAGGAHVLGWQAAVQRAQGAPQLLRPGLLASSIPGGGAYAGVAGGGDLDGVLAAAEDGRVATVSLGSARSLPARVSALLGAHELVVADLPAGAEGERQLGALSAARAPAELLLVVERVPDRPGGELLWSAAAGVGANRSGGGELTSQTTNERGLIASVDLAPTILEHLRLSVPPDMRGKPIESEGALASGSLRTLMARLHVIGGRRLKALATLLCAWVLLLLVLAPFPKLRGRALRAGALAVCWTPIAVLVSAALAPSAAVEYATITVCAFALGALSDALVPWPRALIAPAACAVLALSVDALAGTQLLMRSLLGPNPLLGARFYGIGNELKSALAVLVLAALAGALYPAVRGARAALWFAAGGVVLAAVEGSARIGAGVGGVILVAAGFAVAAAAMLPGELSRRRVLFVLLAPLAALAALAALDLATAHGGGHFTGSVLHARSPQDVRDVIVRRYRAAWGELRNHAMPVATLIALVCVVLGLRRRTRLLAPVGGDPAWQAVLAGGATAGIVGALVEDSGPVLLVVAVFALGCVLAYVWGGVPAPAPAEHARAAAEEVVLQ